jgi:hypothetical protein
MSKQPNFFGHYRDRGPAVFIPTRLAALRCMLIQAMWNLYEHTILGVEQLSGPNA